MNNKESKIKTKRQTGRALRTRARLKTSDRPRLIVSRSNTRIYAQVIAVDGRVIAAANDLKLSGMPKTESAKKVGEEIAKKAVAKEIKEVAFDRSGYRYHGRVKALAEAAREGGLVF